MMPNSVMIFAAGFGTRMGDLTRDKPKPMINVAGKPLIDHTVTLARAVEPAQIVANVHYKPDSLIQRLKELDVAVSHETPEILDTGGGLKRALPLLGDGPVFTQNSDAIWAGPNPLQMLCDAWDPARMDALLICVPLTQTVGRKGVGDFTLGKDGQISRGPEVVYGGIQILKTEGLRDILDPVFSLNKLWDRMSANGRLFGLSYPGRWCDVGHPGGIQLAEDLIADV